MLVVMATLQVRQVGRQHALMKACLWSLLNIFLKWLYMHFACCLLLRVIYHACTVSWGTLQYSPEKDLLVLLNACIPALSNLKLNRSWGVTYQLKILEYFMSKQENGSRQSCGKLSTPSNHNQTLFIFLGCAFPSFLDCFLWSLLFNLLSINISWRPQI